MRFHGIPLHGRDSLGWFSDEFGIVCMDFVVTGHSKWCL